eukprot:scaffold143154_cov20-Tisochrysis_lutea.AAC.3
MEAPSQSKGAIQSFHITRRGKTGPFKRNHLGIQSAKKHERKKRGHVEIQCLSFFAQNDLYLVPIPYKTFFPRASNAATAVSQLSWKQKARREARKLITSTFAYTSWYTIWVP